MKKLFIMWDLATMLVTGVSSNRLAMDKVEAINEDVKIKFGEEYHGVLYEETCGWIDGCELDYRVYSEDGSFTGMGGTLTYRG